MEQHSKAVVKQEEAATFEKWCFQQTVEIEHTRKELEHSKRDMESRQRELDRQKRDFERSRDLELDRMKHEQSLFDMKWKILESELEKLAAEKQRMERQRDFYSRVNEYESGYENGYNRGRSSNVVKGEMFFMGVGNEMSLRKRYKDLIKIYHPDNLDGDTETIQEINREYDALKRKLDIM